MRVAAIGVLGGAAESAVQGTHHFFGGSFRDARSREDARAVEGAGELVQLDGDAVLEQVQRGDDGRAPRTSWGI